jgi:membrane-bound lytic murein transglycosylase D
LTFSGKKVGIMHRYVRFTIITLLLTIITGYGWHSSHAKETRADNPMQLVVPELSIPSYSPPSLCTTAMTSLFASENVLADADETSSSRHILVLSPDFAKKIRVVTLYETHGFNKAVEQHLHYYSKKSKKEFLIRLNRAGRYLEIMAEIFREKNLPEELVFLPLIESGFKLNAYSPKRAAGPWQFIPGTARKYGLKINWWVDERRDPIKSTIAAAEYLSDLYEMFDSWNLALAAYNAGEGKIRRAVSRTKSYDFWKLRKTRHIKRETKNYVPSYIAATAIALDPESFGFEDVTYHDPLKFDEVVIDAPMDLEVVAKFTGVSVKEIKGLNPELRRWFTPPNVSSYTLKIPEGTKEIFLTNLENAGEDEILYVEFYTIRKGDTVGRISRRFGVPTQAIIDLNFLNRRALIVTGKTILIPTSGKGKSSSSSRIRPILKSRPTKKSI